VLPDFHVGYIRSDRKAAYTFGEIRPDIFCLIKIIAHRKILVHRIPVSLFNENVGLLVIVILGAGFDELSGLVEVSIFQRAAFFRPPCVETGKPFGDYEPGLYNAVDGIYLLPINLFFARASFYIIQRDTWPCPVNGKLYSVRFGGRRAAVT